MSKGLANSFFYAEKFKIILCEQYREYRIERVDNFGLLKNPALSKVFLFCPACPWQLSRKGTRYEEKGKWGVSLIYGCQIRKKSALTELYEIIN